MGVFLVQSDITQFLAFFIYGPDGKPTWYTAELERDTQATSTVRSTRSRGRTSPTRGRVTTSRPSVPHRSSRPISTTPRCAIRSRASASRQNGRAPDAHAVSARRELFRFDVRNRFRVRRSHRQQCALPRPVRPRGHEDGHDTASTLTFTFVDTDNSGIVCRVTGPLTHLGRLYKLTNGQFSCTGQGLNPTPTPATIDSYHPTGQGIEGRLTSTTPDGCNLSLRFAAVLNN